MFARLGCPLLAFSCASILGVCVALENADTCAQSPAGGNACLLQADRLRETDRGRAVSPRSPRVRTQGKGINPQSSDEIPHSNRKGSNACKCTKSDCIGEECAYKCDPGYIPIGRHVYREYIRDERVFIKEGFFGGRCEKLCSGHDTCKGEEVPVRSWQKKGRCFASTCVEPSTTTGVGSGGAEDEALLSLAKGNWALWRRARSKISGLYVDNINSKMQPAWKVGKADVTGCGLIMECIALSMGLQSKASAQARVLMTLRALSGKLPKVNKIKRSVVGNFFPGVMDTRTGAANKKSNGGGNTPATGLLFGGILFAKTYFQRNFPDDPITKNITDYAVELFQATEWDKMVCSTKNKVEPMHGTKVAWDVTPDKKCLNPAQIRGGQLQFNEAYVGRWFAYEWACTLNSKENCLNMKRMWEAQQATKNPKKGGVKWSNPNSDVTKERILSKWGSYVVQLPNYMAYPFNSDEDFQNKFFKSYAVEKDLYAHSPYFAPDRYGLGAGPTEKECHGVGYVADRLGGDAGCLTYSPHGVVGYLATGDPQVKQDVLKMLADGEAVTMIEDPVTGEKHPILDRRMLLSPRWRPYAITMIDISSELFGLAAYFLGNDFFTQNTNYFDNPEAPWV